MFCEECGHKAKKGDKFCENCGAKLHAEEKATEKEEKITKQEPKKEMNPKTKKKIITGCVVALTLFGGYKVVDSRVQPEKIAKRYFEALVEQDANKLYGFFDIDGKEMTSKKMFKKVIKNSFEEYEEEITNYAIDSSNHDNADINATVTIAYNVKGDKERKLMDVDLYKTKEKKWLFFDNWVIEADGELIVEDYKLELPKGSKVTIEDEKIDKYLNKKLSTKTKDVYEIDEMFVGKYKINVTLPFGIEIEDLKEVNTYSSYKPVITKETVGKETVKTLEKSAKENIELLYKGVIDEKKFNDIESNFKAKDIKLDDLEDSYSYLVKRANSFRKLKSLDVDKVNITRVSYEDDTLIVNIEADYKYELNPKENDKFKDEFGKVKDNCVLEYKYTEKEFKLVDAKYLETYFRTY